ncbi:MAG: hypothetical protein GF405_00635 [Candidatus Eisenbacteria bacterium]|nr:hypothetical protein [Candidatus Eisenbacteria bacterium]
MNGVRVPVLLLAAAAVVLAAAPVTAADDVAMPEPGRLKGTPILLASASYPGLGQLLNGKEMKAAVIGAAEALLIAGLVVEDRRTRNAYRRYQETRDAEWFDEYSEHYDRRQTLIWWAVGAALYAITDAYVDAHLAGFGESLSPGLERPLAVEGEVVADRVAVGLSIRF